jgi:uncharacterized cupredoxin-like copper-binding protein
MNRSACSVTAAALLGAVLVLAATIALPRPAAAHKAHTSFSAGEPGNPKRPARTITVTMEDSDGKMTYVPNRIEVRKGEQIRFVLKNAGALDHEFLLATTAENLKHAELMKKYPEMEHDDPNGKRLKPEGTSEILWRFTKKGEFEFSCLIPGHREAGMLGTIIVK